MNANIIKPMNNRKIQCQVPVEKGKWFRL